MSCTHESTAIRRKRGLASARPVYQCTECKEVTGNVPASVIRDMPRDALASALTQRGGEVKEWAAATGREHAAWMVEVSARMDVERDYATKCAEVERLRAEVAALHAKHPEASCYDAMPKLRAVTEAAIEERRTRDLCPSTREGAEAAIALWQSARRALDGALEAAAAQRRRESRP